MAYIKRGPVRRRRGPPPGLLGLGQQCWTGATGLRVCDVAEIPPLTGLEQLDWAKSVVDATFCDQLTCGVTTQAEAGMAAMFACGLAYPRGGAAWCSTFCQPWWPQIKAKYGVNCSVMAGIVQSPVLSTPQSQLPPPPTGYTQPSAWNPGYGAQPSGYTPPPTITPAPAPRAVTAPMYTPAPAPQTPTPAVAQPMTSTPVTPIRTDLGPAPAVTGSQTGHGGSIEIVLPSLDPRTGLPICPAEYPFQSLDDKGQVVCRKTAAGGPVARGGETVTAGPVPSEEIIPLDFYFGAAGDWCSSETLVDGVPNCLLVAVGLGAAYWLTRRKRGRG